MEENSKVEAVSKYINQTPPVRFVILAAGTIIIIAAIKASASFLVPILLSVLFAVVFWPPLIKMHNKGMSIGMALGVVLMGVAFLFLLLIGFLGITAASFGDQLPIYQTQLGEQIEALREMLQSLGIPIQEGQLLSGENQTDVGAILGFVASALGQLLTSSFVILFYVIFMLVEAGSFRKKVEAAFKSNPDASGYFTRVLDSMQYYLVIKTRINVVTGASIAVALWLIGLDFALLWGFLAMLLNYVPNFGSIIAAIPAVILAFIQFGPSFQFLLVVLVYVIVNIMVGYVVEPRMMGKGLGLSALIVLIAVIFWGWILGPIGLILSVPITVAMKIFLESYDGSRWLSILMGEEDEADKILEASTDT